MSRKSDDEPVDVELYGRLGRVTVRVGGQVLGSWGAAEVVKSVYENLPSIFYLRSLPKVMSLVAKEGKTLRKQFLKPIYSWKVAL